MAADSFVFRMGTTVFFGNNIVSQLPDRVRELNASKVLIVTDKGVRQAGLLEKIEKLLEEAGFQTAVFDDVEPDPGLETVHRCATFFKEKKCNLVVALGGGSPMDTAKGARVLADNGGHIRDYAGVNKVPRPASVPLITIPTTSGTGSEVTIFAVLSDWEANVKITITSPYLAANLALVDPSLTVSAPPGITAASGVDALAHAVETFVSNIAQPPADALALKAVEIIGANLRPAVARGNNLEARTQMSLGSLIAGMAFNNAFLGLTHSIGAALSGHVHISHGVAIALLLPHVMEYNAMACPEKYRSIAAALGEKVEAMSAREGALAAARGVQDLVKDVNLPQRLSELKVKKDDLKSIASNAMGHGMVKMNPRRPTEAEVLGILEKAF